MSWFTLFVKCRCSKKQLLLFYHITEKNASFLFRNITKAAGKIPTALIL
jgi:hypothetical protein